MSAPFLQLLVRALLWGSGIKVHGHLLQRGKPLTTEWMCCEAHVASCVGTHTVHKYVTFNAFRFTALRPYSDPICPIET